MDKIIIETLKSAIGLALEQMSRGQTLIAYNTLRSVELQLEALVKKSDCQ